MREVKKSRLRFLLGRNGRRQLTKLSGNANEAFGEYLASLAFARLLRASALVGPDVSSTKLLQCRAAILARGTATILAGARREK